MIDFRYHLVSLISVFLALAVGIALGAGPLKETIGDQLTGQVEQLRQEKDDLRAQLDATTAQGNAYQSYLDAASEDLVGGLLPRDVAVVALPGAGQQTVEAIEARLEQSGATIGARVDVTARWTDEADLQARETLVAELGPSLDPAPAADASVEQVLGTILAQALGAEDPADPAALGPNAAALLEGLAGAGLVTVDQAPGVPVDAVVVVAPAVADPRTATPGAESTTAASLALVSALDEPVDGLVVAGPAADSAELVSLIRADGDLGVRVATVDTVVDVTGQLSVPRALATAIAGTVGHYGFASSAQAIVPPRTALEPEDAALEPAA